MAAPQDLARDAAGNVYFRDLSYLWTIVVQAWFFATPVVYPPHLVVDRLPFWLERIYQHMPMTVAVRVYRNLMYDLRMPRLIDFGTLTVYAVVALFAAIFLNKTIYGRYLLALGNNEEAARLSGIPVGRVDAMLMVALSATVIVSARVIGALLISAMLVLPAGTARLLTRSIGRMLWSAPLLGAAFGFVGMFASWYAEVPSGAMITLVDALVFGVTFVGVDVTRRRAIRGLDDHAVLA